FIVCGLADRTIGGFRAFEDAADIKAGQSVRVRDAPSITHLSTGGCECPILEDRWHCVADRESSQLFTPANKKTIGPYHEPAYLHLLQTREHIPEIAFGARIQYTEL